MSSPDDASSRLSSALDEILSAKAEPTADWSVDDEDDAEDDADVDGAVDDAGAASGDQEATQAVDVVDVVETAEPEPVTPAEPYVLPTIVPATAHVAEPQPVPTLRRATPAQPAQPASPAAPGATAPTPAAAPTRPATGWGDHMTSLPTNAQGSGLRAPGRRPRVRRVTRVLRHIDPWSTFKVGLLFSVVAYVVGLTSGVLLWRVADSTGTLDNVERWFTQFGWETFELKGGEIFHNAWIIGLFGAVALTGGLVLLATLFNLVSDIVGGIRMTVLEEEVVERTVSSTRRYVVRRPPVGTAGAPSDSKWDVDGDDPAPTAGANGSASPASADWSVDDDPTVEQPAGG